MHTYAELAEELATPDGVASIREKLQKANVLEATYWVCAFSVNHHASICTLELRLDVFHRLDAAGPVSL